jgi:hypothetical protein
MPGSLLDRFAWLLIVIPLAILISIAGYQLFFSSGPFGLDAKTIVTALLVGFGILLGLVI